MTSILRLSFSPSRYLAGGLTIAHCVGLVIVWIVNWSPWLQISSPLVILASWLFYLRRDALLRPRNSVISVLLKSDGGVEATTREGAIISGRQIAGSFVHPWGTTIHWRPDEARLSRVILVLPDSLPSDDFRQLRVWLKWRWTGGEKSDRRS